MATTIQPDRRALGFVWRVDMERTLGGTLPPPRPRAGYRLVPFEPALLPALAEVEFEAFAGSADARAFAAQLATPTHTLAAWERLLGSRRFEPRATRVLVRGDTPCGLVQASRGGHGVGILSSLAVRPADRGGNGRALVLAALHRFQALGFARAGLTVTAENEGALRLYEQLGFEEVGWSIATFPPVR